MIKQSPTARSETRRRYYFLIAFVALFSVLVFWCNLSMYVIALYGSVSLLLFMLYGWDKLAARQQLRRVPENCLHLLALFGGWPGAMLAQNMLRHKSAKPSFRQIGRWMVALNLLILTLGLLYFCGILSFFIF